MIAGSSFVLNALAGFASQLQNGSNKAQWNILHILYSLLEDEQLAGFLYTATDFGRLCMLSAQLATDSLNTKVRPCSHHQTDHYIVALQVRSEYLGKVIDQTKTKILVKANITLITVLFFM